jgi:hypothetical protein
MKTAFHMSQDAINAFGALIGRRMPMLKRTP